MPRIRVRAEFRNSPFENDISWNCSDVIKPESSPILLL